MLSGFSDEQIANAYAICKMQASVDGAFAEPLLQHKFAAAWELCAAMVDMEPAQEIMEKICIDECGNFRLSRQPTSDVQIYDRYTLVATFPPSLQRSRCDPALCCYCNLTAKYMIGESRCDIPSRFIQAVARLFDYMIENAGDTELDPQILGKCGALAFLSPDLTYVL